MPAREFNEQTLTAEVLTRIVEFEKSETGEYNCRYNFVLKPSTKRSVRKRRR